MTVSPRPALGALRLLSLLELLELKFKYEEEDLDTPEDTDESDMKCVDLSGVLLLLLRDVLNASYLSLPHVCPLVPDMPLPLLSPDLCL